MFYHVFGYSRERKKLPLVLHYTSYFVLFLIQETDILTDNLAKHTLNDGEVLFETRDLRTLANLQESMVSDVIVLRKAEY